MQASLFLALLALAPVAVLGEKIKVTSAGWADGNFAKIDFKGKTILEGQGQRAITGGGGIGINYAIIKSDGTVKRTGSANTYGNKFGAKQFVLLLQNNLMQTDYLVIATGDEASNCIQDESVSKAFKDLGATKSFDHFMYKDTAGKYWPFQCGGNKNMPAEFKKADGQFKLSYLDNPLTAFRNSYVLIVQKGGKVLHEEGKRPTTGLVDVEIDIAFKTTTTTVTTTTTNTDLEFLQAQLAKLQKEAEASTNSVEKTLVGLVAKLEEKLEDEVEERKAAVLAATNAAGAMVKELAQDLEAEKKAREAAEQKVTYLENALQDMKKATQATLTLAKTNGVASSWTRDSSPTVEADGTMVTIKGSMVMFESENCGAADLCELHRTVQALAGKLEAVGSNSGENDD